MERSACTHHVRMQGACQSSIKTQYHSTSRPVERNLHFWLAQVRVTPVCPLFLCLSLSLSPPCQALYTHSAWYETVFENVKQSTVCERPQSSQNMRTLYVLLWKSRSAFDIGACKPEPQENPKKYSPYCIVGMKSCSSRA